MKEKRISTKNLVQSAVLISVMLIMAFTPLGYLKTLGLEITFIMIPVIIGAISMGPASGAFLGAIFGITSFIQCFGMSAFGAALLSVNPIYTFIVCVVPRTLMGFLTGLIFRSLSKNGNEKFMPYAISSLSGALLNTVLFMSTLMLLFGSTDFIKGFQGQLGVFAFIIAFVGVNGLVEACVCFIVGAAISRAVVKMLSVK